MAKTIIKSNGERVKVDLTKIERAVSKALGETRESIRWELFDTMLADINENIEDNSTTNDVHRLIELKLMTYGLRDTAKAYMNHRDRMLQVEDRGWDMTQLQSDIYNQKYRHNKETFSGFLDRVSGGNHAIRKLIKHKQFLPAGRILANRGLHLEGRKITLSNCYVMNPPADNIESIFEAAKELARTYSYGGGCGLDISKLRPNGAKVNNNALSTTGGLSFAELYSMVTAIIGGKGRRGALMISMRCDHPDIVEFINSKTDLSRLTKANISVMFTDAFLEAALEGRDFMTKFIVEDTDEVITRLVNARDVFMTFVKNNSDYAEPGALYWGRIENWNLLSNDPKFSFAGVNPCAEEPLPANGSCLLGSLNLSEFVVKPFTKDAYIDFHGLQIATREAVRYLNEVLDEGLPLHPLAAQRKTVKDWRQIGLGVFGIADMFIKLRMTYGSEQSLTLSRTLSNEILKSAVIESINLAKEYGPYPMFHSQVCETEFAKANIPKHLLEEIGRHGLRNSQLLTIAPTGTLSTMWGVSGGIEPIFNISYTRKTKSLHEGKETEYKVFTPIAKEYMEKFNTTDLPEFFVTANDIHWKDRIAMQAAWQQNIDASISSTLNLKNETTEEEIFHIYMTAWQAGLKGITVYRDGCKRAGILVNEGVTTQDSAKEMTVKQLKDLMDKKILESVLNDPNKCPMCEGHMKHEGGCHECIDCGYSPCAL